MTLYEATQNNIALAAKRITSRELVAMPTETVYGLAANALDGQAIAKIFAVKQRPAFNPLITHVANLKDAQALGMLDDNALKLTQSFWPGPLTLVVPKAKDCPLHDLVTADLPSLGLRVPNHPVAQALIKAAGVPLAAPSANRSGFLSPTTPAHVQASLGDDCPFVLAGGMAEVGLESTIVDMTEETPVLLRPGAVTLEQLETVLGHKIDVFEGATTTPKAPGMTLKHYSTCAQLRLNAVDIDPDEALLAFGNTGFMGLKGGGFAKDLPGSKLQNLSESGDLFEAAANLFKMLHILDVPENPKIAVMPIPNEGVGVAINERLFRAAQE